MRKNERYILDLTNCLTGHDVLIAIEADLNARKQLKQEKKSWIKRIFG